MGSFHGSRPGLPVMDHLVVAIRSAKAATVYELMGAVEDVNVLSSEGDSALVACAAVGRLDVLSKLLTAGANPDATSNSGMSALAASSMSGHLPCVKRLLDAGAQVDVLCGQSDSTALISAAQEGHRAVCELLLEHGANPKRTDAYGNSALGYAQARELDSTRQMAEFERWARIVEARAQAIEAEPTPPRPPFAYKLKDELQRCHTSKTPSADIWRPGGWIHQKRPPSEAVVRQGRGRPFNPTGYLEPEAAPRVERVGALRHFGLQENAVAPQPPMPRYMGATAPPEPGIVAAAAAGRTDTNPALFSDDVGATRGAVRSSVLDGAAPMRLSDRQDLYLQAAFPGVPVRHGGTKLYAGTNLHSLISVDSAAATLTPVLKPPSNQSLAQMLAAPKKTTTAEVLQTGN